MSAHTKEPWSFSNDLNGRVNIFGNGGQQVIFSGAQFINQPNNVRRIVACVNACRGVSNEDLEMDNAAFIQVFNERSQLRDDLATAEQDARQKMARISRLEAEREQMLAVLKQAAEINPFGSVENAIVRDAAKRLIDNTEG